MQRHFFSRIGTRLAAAFAVLLALSLALSLSASARLEQAQANLRELGTDHLANLALVFEIGGHADDASRKLLVLIGSQRPERVRAYAEIDAANRRLDLAMTTLQARLPQGPRHADFMALQARLQEYRTAYGHNIDLIEADEPASALRMLVNDTELALAGLAQARDTLARSEQRAAEEAADALEARILRDRGLLAGACTLALLLGGGLAWWVTRTIVRPLAQAEAVARHMVDGDYSRRVRSSSQDEIGSLSQALNALAGAAGEREARLRHLAEQDAMTGLAQREPFIVQGNARLLRAAAGQLHALLCLDIDRLKMINALLGFEAGDAVIVECARRLRMALPESVLLGRLTGGTLVALIAVERAEDASRLAMAIRQALEGEVRWHDHPLDLSICMGLTLSPMHGNDCESLLRHAESALFEAKRQRVTCVVYAPSLEASRLSHLSLLSELHLAVSQHQLRMFLQPKFSTESCQLCGFEALVRWLHPQRGWISPGEFIPFAESSGKIREITRWMLESAVAQLKRWSQERPALYIAVNLSVFDLLDPNLPEYISQLLAEAGVAPSRLQLELTESGLMAAGPDPVRTLSALHQLGLHLAIDDFGTGQSSLAYLQRLPVHELKIDRSFVDGFDADPTRRKLMQSIVSLGHSLGLTVTAEGVETEAERQALKLAGCDLMQGFLLGRPMDSGPLQTWLEKTQDSAARASTPSESEDLQRV